MAVNKKLFKIEPTTNIPPRSAGRKIDGSLVQEVKQNKTVVVLCEVSGFPVPVFRLESLPQ
jgi:hypothetical protein